MTYIEYLNDFNQWLEEDNPTDNVIILYYAFLNMFNRRGWPRWAGVDTRRLMSMVRTTSNKTAYRARDALISAGFIEYRPGKKGRASEYRLLERNTKNDTANNTENDIANDITNDTKSRNDTASDIENDTANDTESKNDTESDIESDTENDTPNKTKTKDKDNSSGESNDSPEDIKSIPDGIDRCTARQMQPVIDAWNALGLQRIKLGDATTTRYKQLKARIKSYGLDGVMSAIKKIKTSPFLQGDNTRGWVISFDWFIKPNNFPKVLEGNYDERKQPESPRGCKTPYGSAGQGPLGEVERAALDRMLEQMREGENS